MPDVSSRELSCKHSQTVRRANTSRARRLVQRPSWAIRDPFRAVLGAKRPVRRPSWAPRGPSGGRLGHQEARPEAVLDARRPVQRQSWTAGGPSASRLGRWEPRLEKKHQIVIGVFFQDFFLGRQEGRPEAVFAARRPVRRPSWPSGGQNV